MNGYCIACKKDRTGEYNRDGNNYTCEFCGCGLLKERID